MSAIADRIRRPANAPTVLLQARIAPELRAAVHEAAASAGVSTSLYMEAMLRDLINERGVLPAVESPRPQREELPINFAA